MNLDGPDTKGLRARERRLIAAIARDPGLYWAVCPMLPDAAFVHEVDIWRSLAHAVRFGETIELPADWIASESPLVEARALVDAMDRREMLPLGQRLERGLADPAVPLRDWLAVWLDRLHETRLFRALVPPVNLKPVEAIFGTLQTDLRTRRFTVMEEGRPVSGLPTGFRWLDKFLGGLQPGLHILAGAPGVGKTTAAIKMTLATLEAELPVLYLTFNETPDRMLLRIVCQQNELEMKEFSDGIADPEIIEDLFQQHRARLDRLHILKGGPELTPDQVRRTAEALMDQHGRRSMLIIIDFLQFWAAGTRNFSEFRHEVAKLLFELRDLSVAIRCPILCLTSQNRGGQGTTELSSLEGTTDIEYAADSIMFLVAVKQVGRATDYDVSDRDMLHSHTLSLALKKNRYGETGQLLLKFSPKIGRMSDA